MYVNIHIINVVCNFNSILIYHHHAIGEILTSYMAIPLTSNVPIIKCIELSNKSKFFFFITTKFNS